MKGILFKPDMIKAIVEGRKTVTRRKMQNQPTLMDKVYYKAFRKDYGGRKPRYQVGETVYIKEAWRVEKENPIRTPDTGAIYDYDPPTIMFKADKLPHIQALMKWESPLFLPAKYARYFIKITDVRAEMTRNITTEDCLLEGIYSNSIYGDFGFHWESKDSGYETAKTAYFTLYDSINGKGAHEKNWDWRYEFSFESPSGVEEKNDISTS